MPLVTVYALDVNWSFWSRRALGLTLWKRSLNLKLPEDAFSQLTIQLQDKYCNSGAMRHSTEMLRIAPYARFVNRMEK
jgi:hypothetical protein